MKSRLMVCAFFALTACVAPQSQTPGSDAEAGSAQQASLIPAAVANPDRLQADIERDAGRKPGEVLEFIGIQPGMVVLDMFAGGGYYSELLSYAVGPQGRVVAHNNTPYATIAAKNIAERYADGRLPNVEQLLGDNNELLLPADTFDVALFVLSYHDVYYIDGDRGWVLIDRPAMLAEVFRAMKPGAVVAVIDHVGDPATPLDVAKQIHRIDPTLVKADFGAAGFRLDAESDVLRNKADDYSVIPMLPHIRGRSDRFVMRFVKPGN